MPVLSNARHERFAQELAKGQSNVDAYEAAGYSTRDTGAAARLAGKDSVCQRVAELQAEIAERTAEKLSVTRADVITELSKIGLAQVNAEDIRPTDKRSALLNIAQMEGWVVSKHEHSGPGGGPIKHDLSGLSDEQLAQLEAIFGAITGFAHAGGHQG